MDKAVVLSGETELIQKIDGTVNLSATIDGQTLQYLGGGALAEMEVTPTAEDQRILPEEGYIGIKAITVKAIPNNYGLVTWTGAVLTIT